MFDQAWYALSVLQVIVYLPVAGGFISYMQMSCFSCSLHAPFEGSCENHRSSAVGLALLLPLNL